MSAKHMKYMVLHQGQSLADLSVLEKSEPEQLSSLTGIWKQMEKGRLVTCFVSPVSF